MICACVGIHIRYAPKQGADDGICERAFTMRQVSNPASCMPAVDDVTCVFAWETVAGILTSVVSQAVNTDILFNDIR